MKRMWVIGILWLFATSVQAESQSSVFKVCAKHDCFYLAGTVHILPHQAYPLPSVFEQAYQASSVLLFEAEIPADDDVQAQQAMLSTMRYQDGSTLSSRLSPAVRQQLILALRRYDLPLAPFEQYHAGFIATQLTLLEAKRVGLDDIGVDSYFEKKAKVDHKPRRYLETLDFQLQLIKNLGDGREAEFIEAALVELAQTEASLKEIIQAWRRGSLDDIEQAVLIPTQSQDPTSYELLFVKRNQQWLPKLQQLFGNQDTELVLVGAGHLAGLQGLVHLLKAKGYQVTQLEHQ